MSDKKMHAEKPQKDMTVLPTPDVDHSTAGRNMGIELFRIVAMCLVVLVHVLGYGGIRGATEKFTSSWVAAYGLNVIAYSCVDCYALITGYTNVKAKTRYRRIVYLWLEVFAITVFTTLIAKYAFHVDVTPDEWKNALMPLTRRELWYFNAYFVMFFFLPILNQGVQALERWQLRLTILSLLALTMTLPRIGEKDIFVLNNGYSALWLMILYLVGAYFRLYGFPRWSKWYVTLPTFFVAAGVALLQYVQTQELLRDGRVVEGEWLYKHSDFLTSYTSPCMVIMAVCLLLFFGQLKIHRKVPSFVIGNLGKATFGVFAIHVSSMVWYHFLKNRYAPIGKMPPLKLIVFTVIAVLGFYLACSLYSLARFYLFKLLRIYKLVDWIADRFPHRKVKKRSMSGRNVVLRKNKTTRQTGGLVQGRLPSPHLFFNRKNSDFSALALSGKRG